MDNNSQKISKLTKSLMASTMVASLFLTSAPTMSFAAEEDDELEEVIVTGSRTGRALNKIPGAVSIINQAAIKRDVNLTADLTAMLARTVPGYGGSFQQLDRRGESLRGRVSLRLLDGVPQGSPLRDGSRDSIFTDLGVVERVEVVNGPSATEGIGASGGIINYITKTPSKMGTEVQVSTQYRSQFKTDSDSWREAITAAHKNEDYDILVAGSFAETGIGYDGDGATLAIGPSGSDRDSQSNNLFIKVGANFGDGDEQRLEITHSNFLLECQCRYSINLADPGFGFHFNNKIPITSKKESPPGALASFNDFVQNVVTYTHDNLFGGKLQIMGYDASQAMRFESERGRSKSDPVLRPFPVDADGFPTGPFPVEQSEIASEKQGLRTSWSTDSLFGNEGFGLQVGADFVKDEAQQRLALSNATWVPPMKYTSFAPFAQFTLDIDRLTVSAGIRHEDGKLDVEDYTSSWDNDRRFVLGGEINYGDWLPNLGAIYRVTDEWSVYASYSKGFTLPNAGIPLRNQRCSNDTSSNGDPSDPLNFPFGGIQPDGCPNDPQISVNDIIDLEAIIVDNIEVGFSWSGENGKFGISLYESTSDFGANLVTDPVIGDFVLRRAPEKIQGLEVSGNYNVSEDVNISVIYSTTTGKTNSSSAAPEVLDKEIGVFNIPPNKLVATIDWQFSEDGNVVLGSHTSFARDINEGVSGEEHIIGFTLFNMTVNYSVFGGTISLGADNLLDKVYLLPTSNVLFFQNYTHGRGREVTLGFTVSY